MLKSEKRPYIVYVTDMCVSEVLRWEEKGKNPQKKKHFGNSLIRIICTHHTHSILIEDFHSKIVREELI